MINARDHSAEQLDAWAPADLDRETWGERLSSNITCIHTTASITAKTLFESHGFVLDWEQERTRNGNLFKTFVLMKGIAK